MKSSLTYIDLFAGAGGLSEGFTKEGYIPVAHVEMDKDACNTLKTRLAYHHLKENGMMERYVNYLKQNISRDDLWDSVPEQLISSVINAEISNKSIDSIFDEVDKHLDSKKVDLVVGGPPCQAYSVVGRSRDPKGMKWDKRNYLFRYYANFLERYKPKLFLFENVLGLLSAGSSRYVNEMLSTFGDLGYSVDFKVLNAEDYGVLQKRRRVIIIGRKGKTNFTFPEIPISENVWQIKNDLFSDLPKLKPGQEMDITKYSSESGVYLEKTGIRNGLDFVTQHITRNHNDRDLEIYSLAIKKWLDEGTRLKYTDVPSHLQTHKNTVSFLDRYKVVNPFGSSHTMVAHIAKDGHHYIYPDKKQIRSISVREAARIQSFPDDFFFEGGRTAAFRQIGNAVPPLMAQAIAKELLELL